MSGVKQKIKQALCFVSIAALLSLPCAPASAGFTETLQDGTSWGSKVPGLGNLIEENPQGKALCEKEAQDRGGAPSKDPTDPCYQASLMKKGAEVQETAGMIYAAVAATCLVGCFVVAATGACTYGGYAAMANDFVGAAAVGNAGQAITGQITGPLMMLSMGGDHNTIEALTQKKGESDEAFTERQNAAEQKHKDDQAKSNSCKAAGVNAVQSAVRWFNYKASMDKVNEAYTQKLAMNTGAMPQLTMSGPESGGGDTSGSGITATQGTAGRKEGTENGDLALKNDRGLEELAAEAGQTQVLRNFENVTGKPISELEERVKAGMPPLFAAAQMASGAIGAEGAQAGMSLAATASQLAPEFKDEFDAADKKFGMTDRAFDSLTGRSGGHGSSGDSGMPDLGALMAGLMPKKPGGRGAAKNPNQIAFGPRGPAASQINRDGFHPPTRSIFEVVGARYQMVAGALLSGSTVLDGKPVSLLPANPYLRK